MKTENRLKMSVVPENRGLMNEMAMWILDNITITTSAMDIYRRKFRSQTSDNMDRWKADMERVREKRKGQKKEDAAAQKGRNVAIHYVFSNDLWPRKVEK